ncbi:MAG: N-acetylneuraminate synthase family protein [Deltaproteobacteria bacterium]|nr:N-acetylneuraminate synthase family protein [Deltaproteobacteria bacterium]
MGKSFTESLSSGKCMVIGEVAMGHDGSLGLAHSYIDAIARAGADAVKFQTHIFDAEGTRAEPFRVPFSPQDATRRDYWIRTAFTEEQWGGLSRHASEKGLFFLSSPFSEKAAAILRRAGVAAWKIPSGETGNIPLLEDLVSDGLPMLLSTGMSPMTEIDAAAWKVRKAECPLVVMQCTSIYPCPPERVGLNMLAVFRERYSCPVGLSDHSGTIYPGLAAATLGIQALEVHVTLSREMFGPDVCASVTTTELAQLVEGVRWIELMRRDEVDKDKTAENLAPLRDIFTKSLVASRSIPAGTILERSMLALKKPGNGIPSSMMDRVIGRRVMVDLGEDDLIREGDLE